MFRHLLVVTTLFTLAGCAGRAPVSGWLYTGVTAPEAASAQVANKTGEACAISILGAVAVGDASIDTAKRNGGIASVSTVDGKSTNILGIYMQYCTIVRGK